MTQPPADFEAFRRQVSERRTDLPPRLRQIAEFALMHPDEIAFGTAAGVASAAAVQPSSLVRFAQLLGFTGFSDLQNVFRNRLISGDHLDRIERLSAARRHGAAPDMLQSFIDSSVVSLQRLASSPVRTAIEDAAIRLAAARSIEIIGLRRVFTVASHLSYGFSKLGIRARLIDGIGGFEPAHLGAFDASDALIAISFRPYTPQTIEIARTVSAVGASVIAITDTALSPLAEFASTRIELVETDFSGFRSLAASIAVASTLMTRVAELRAIARQA
jgi:DNA-binding MurR/RpiR family transcriptional regulator